MRRVRVIPRLDVKGPNLVKGIHCEGLRVLGPPEYFAHRYYMEGADELLYMDIVASLYGRNNLRDIVERTAKDVFIPITVGGGIRTLEDIRVILRAGADKVAINTAAIQRPALVQEGAQVFGSQCIVVSIEAKLMPNGRYEALCDNGRQETGVDVMEWARHVADIGAGEILITSIDREGTGQGYDLALTQQVAHAVSIPVIACGGAGNLAHLCEVIERTPVCAVSAASVFHYHQLTSDLVDQVSEEGNIEFLKKFTREDAPKLKRFTPCSIGSLKSSLAQLAVATIRSVADRERTSEPTGSVVTRTQPDAPLPMTAVVDYGCGNLLSIEHALRQIGAPFYVTDDPDSVATADRMILPGVGAFGDGMYELRQRGLIRPILAHVQANKPLLGICLGMQLLLSESEEFGCHEGLNIIPGRVVKLSAAAAQGHRVTIPHIGWNTIEQPLAVGGSQPVDWHGTLLASVAPGAWMYFVHSYITVLDDQQHQLAETVYGNNRLCSVLRNGNTYGCQFHPERSGTVGLAIYESFVFGGQPALEQIVRGGTA